MAPLVGEQIIDTGNYQRSYNKSIPNRMQSNVPETLAIIKSFDSLVT